MVNPRQALLPEAGGLLSNFVRRFFKHKEFYFAVKVLIYGLDQKLSLCKHL